MNKYFICGGAGFIGSHFVDELLSRPDTKKVTIFDNFSSGRRWHYKHHSNDKRLSVIRGDASDIVGLCHAMRKGTYNSDKNNYDVVIHLASNPDISKAITNPTIDFYKGTYLTNNVIEAMRNVGIKRILYASGSGIYGDGGDTFFKENSQMDLPISTYGASKLAGEALINSYCHMFDISACVFRFANVVGARQTHGVGYDFTKRLIKNPKTLQILGDGTQSKSYVYVKDIIRAVLLANDNMKSKCETYNVATDDSITVTEIANIVKEILSITDLKLEYTGGNRGWKGDVPVIRLNNEKIKSLGWIQSLSSKAAITQSVLDLLPDIKSKRIK